MCAKVKLVTIKNAQKILCLVLCLMQMSETARILAVFPVPSISHQVVFRPLTQELARRGHEVVVVTPDPAFPKGEAPANLTEIDLHNISYPFLHTGTAVQNNPSVFDIRNLFFNIFLEQIKDSEFRKIIEHGSFDLLLLEACVEASLSLSHVFKVPVILVSSFGATTYNTQAVGAPVHPILYPTSFTRRKILNLTMIDVLKEMYTYSVITSYVPDMSVLGKQLGSDLPPFHKLLDNVNMLFVNVHPLFDGNKPVPKNVVHFWNGQRDVNETLPEDLKIFLDSSKNGVIYMSLGSNILPSLLPSHFRSTLTKVFSTLPYDVLLKWDDTEFPGLSSNVKIAKWYPQVAVLQHPNTKLFITQAGLQSTDEAITARVPLIAIPFRGDQFYNSEKCVNYKIGVKLDLDSLTEDKLRDAIVTVIENDSYRRNIKKLASLMYDETQTGLDRAIWWTENVLKYGGSHLRSPASNISLTKYLELELIFILILVSLVGLYVVYKIIYLVFRKVTSFGRNTDIPLTVKRQ